MLSHDLTQARLIDFEFLTFASKTWDIASLFSEMVIGRIKGPERYEYPDNLPEETVIREVVSHYLGSEEIEGFMKELVTTMIGTNYYWILWFLANTESGDQARLWRMCERIESKLNCIKIIKERFSSYI